MGIVMEAEYGFSAIRIDVIFSCTSRKKWRKTVPFRGLFQ